MRPPRSLPLLLAVCGALTPLAAPAQIRTGAGVTAETGVGNAAGAVNTGVGTSPNLVVSPVTSLNASLGGNAILSAPVNSAVTPLNPSAISNAAANSAASEASSPNDGAAKNEAPTETASAPPGTPPEKGPKAATAPPGGPPKFWQTLKELGVADAHLSELIPLVGLRAAAAADAAVAMSQSAEESANDRVLLILAAALSEAPLTKAHALADQVGKQFGFTGDQLQDLNVPVNMGAKVFSEERGAWAETWRRRLALAAKAAALEAAARNAKLLEAAKKQAEILKSHPDFGLLPENLRGVVMGDGPASAPVDGGDPGAPRGPPAEALASARSYIRSIGLGVKLTPRQTEALLDDWLEQRRISPDATLARQLRAALVPGAAAAEAELAKALAPGLRGRIQLIRRLAEENKTTPLGVQEALQARGLLKLAQSIPDEQFENQVSIAVRSLVLERAVKDYRDNAQGNFLRSVARDMVVRSGKSVEEIARDGVFGYVNFAGVTPTETSTGRDPDPTAPHVVFYIRRSDDGKWLIGVYRQNKRMNRPDAELVQALKSWLVAGGVPARDLR